MIIAAFNEPTDWIAPLVSRVPRMRARLFCKDVRMRDTRCEYLPNIGQDHYVTLRYIIENYDDLPDILVVTHNTIQKGEWDFLLCRKLTYVLTLLSSEKRQRKFVQNVGFAAMPLDPRGGGATSSWNPYFEATSERRGSGTGRVPLCRAPVRPLGDWYTKFVDPHHVTQPRASGVVYNDIYAVSRLALRRYPVNVYERLLAQVVACGSLAAEIDHYLERAVKPMYDGAGSGCARELNQSRCVAALERGRAAAARGSWEMRKGEWVFHSLAANYSSEPLVPACPREVALLDFKWRRTLPGYGSFGPHLEFAHYGHRKTMGWELQETQTELVEDLEIRADEQQRRLACVWSAAVLSLIVALACLWVILRNLKRSARLADKHMDRHGQVAAGPEGACKATRRLQR